MLSPSDFGWAGREFLAIDASRILNAAMGNSSWRVICKGITERKPGTVFPLWFPEPKGRPVHPQGYWQPDHATLAELVSRTTEMRSRRWNVERRELVRWPQNWETLIVEAWPQWGIYFAFNEGWCDAVAAAASWIAEIEPEADWDIDDIKEKFGRLSIYWSGDLSDVGKEILGCLEHVSGHICDVCGGPGEIRPGGWMQALCDEHDKDRSWREWLR